MPGSLKPFEDHDVRGAKVIITKAGDGLSDALSLDPESYDLHEQVYFILRGEVQKVRYESVTPSSSDLNRVHIVVTQEIARADADDVAALLETATDRVRLAKEEAEGVQRIDFEGGEGADDGED